MRVAGGGGEGTGGGGGGGWAPTAPRWGGACVGSKHTPAAPTRKPKPCVTGRLAPPPISSESNEGTRVGGIGKRRLDERTRLAVPPRQFNQQSHAFPILRTERNAPPRRWLSAWHCRAICRSAISCLRRRAVTARRNRVRWATSGPLARATSSALSWIRSPTRGSNLGCASCRVWRCLTTRRKRHRRVNRRPRALGTLSTEDR